MTVSNSKGFTLLTSILSLVLSMACQDPESAPRERTESGATQPAQESNDQVERDEELPDVEVGDEVDDDADANNDADTDEVDTGPLDAQGALQLAQVHCERCHTDVNFTVFDQAELAIDLLSRPAGDLEIMPPEPNSLSSNDRQRLITYLQSIVED